MSSISATKPAHLKLPKMSKPQQPKTIKPPVHAPALPIGPSPFKHAKPVRPIYSPESKS